MKIVLTGASSFTGSWFVRALVEAGHEVCATMTRPSADSYEGLRGRRITMLPDACRLLFGCRFGDATMVDLIRDFRPDVLCHHGAEVTDYKSPEFDYATALQHNTRNLNTVIRALVESGCRRIVITGSVFEEHEGAGSEPMGSFSPYGLSKALTASTFRFFAEQHRMALGKFVISNPFGPLEEPRFTAYLMRCWQAGEVARVQTPAYVRDNVHVSLLAKAYATFVGGLPEDSGYSTRNPSGYVESQGAFATRFAKEIGTRLSLPCGLELADQIDFSEPRVRINTMPADDGTLDWCESEAWDQVADYYQCPDEPARDRGA
ncbi:NAD-dependent epimerase/dehydratase family protein [Pirellulimonas nuda]|nr:NAD(P)-dependent oxidoreductase [Pirellulimonas nuda]